MEATDNRFPKSARLHHRNLVNMLYERGKSIYDYPLRLVYLPLTETELKGAFRREVPEGIGRMQMMVTIPKRKLKRAVQRVRMRRRVKEAFRLHRHQLAAQVEDDPEMRLLAMGFIYLADSEAEYSQISGKMVKLLEKLRARISQP